MLDEVQVEIKTQKTPKFKVLIGYMVLGGIAAVFLYFLYQALTNQIKF